MNVVEMKSITKRFGPLTANHDVDFILQQGETHAIVGENGAGKTTLMRILYGQYTADEGQILINGKEETYNISGALKLGIGMVHQNFMQINNMTITENIILGHAPIKGVFIDYKAARKKVSELLNRFGMKISPDALIKNLCVGEKQKIEIIKALYFGANILILDEPTAVLTPQESNELFEIIKELKKDGKSIVFISHKLREVITVADKISVMQKGRMVAHFSRGEANENDIAKAMIGKQDFKLIKNPHNVEIGKEICKVKNLWYFNDDGVAKLRDFSCDVKAGEILGIGGVEGNGQTELINALIGMINPSGGEIYLDGVNITDLSIKERRDLGIGYISEDRMTTGLAIDANMDENVVCGMEDSPEYSSFGFLNKRAIDRKCEQLIDDFDIRGISKKNPVKQLSGGNMQKIVLAREISRNPKFLITAQPTRGLDIGAINFVRNHLLEQKKRGTAILLVSADLEELMSLSDRMIIMYEGRSSGEVTDIKSITEEEIGLMMGGINAKAKGRCSNGKE